MPSSAASRSFFITICEVTNCQSLCFVSLIWFLTVPIGVRLILCSAIKSPFMLAPDQGQKYT